ncbi:MAG: hypothetical protein SFW67_29675 [Myxococcaceae bacterium]|jgi:hypothetical protein|nr:hypothetical protein [Myxococcaceae bacterium]MDX2014406.1 hypothetical protein [Myxococcaceae bacterium]
MHRRYTIHRDGDLLVEDLDEHGKPLEPEPVKPEDRLPIEVTVLGPDDADSRAALIDLLEMALGLETEGPESVGLKKREGHKLGVLS